jgi:hypothetical protein
MFNLPLALWTEIDTCPWNVAILKLALTAYTKWLPYYLDFCQKNHCKHSPT